MKYLIKNKILLLLLLLFIILFPSAISMPQQSKSENIITAVGVDKSGEEYEITIQCLVPYAGSIQETLENYSGKGKSVDEALENLNLDYGKTSGFAHCRVLIFNDEVVKENLTEKLDCFLRRKTNTNNIILISTPKEAKELLGCVKNLDDVFYVVLSNNIATNDQRHYQDFKSIGDYYASYFGKESIAIDVIKVEEEKKEGSGGSSSGSSENSSSGGDSSSGGGSSSPSQKKIKNEGELIILKNGVKLVNLSKSETENLNWFNKEIRDKTLTIKNYNKDGYKDADINFECQHTKANIEVSFKDNTPVYKLKTTVYVRRSEVLSKDLSMKNYEAENGNLSSDLKNEIKNEIEKKLRKAEEHFKTYDYDVVKCYDRLYKFQKKPLKKYLEKKDNKFSIKDVQFVYETEVFNQP